VTVFKFRNLKNGQATPIPPGEFTVGRADDTYIHLDDASVSRRHAVILNQEDGLFVVDLDSANGTAVRGDYLTQRAQVQLGDVVYFGSVPFRVDPEVAGEAEVAPSAGMRTANRAYMRRETERLPAGVAHRPVETLSTEELTAPEVNPNTDKDAGNLNAITMREPEVRPSGQPATFIAGSKASAQVNPVRQAISLPVPQPQRQTLPQSQPSSGTRTYFPEETEQRMAGRAPLQENGASAIPAPAPERVNWEWLLLSFLAGLGTGLLLALYFAKLFIEMGGKVSSLP